jgi:hypothetical protein
MYHWRWLDVNHLCRYLIQNQHLDQSVKNPAPEQPGPSAPRVETTKNLYRDGEGLALRIKVQHAIRLIFGEVFLKINLIKFFPTWRWRYEVLQILVYL